VAAAGETSWHGYARFVLAQAAQAGAALKIGADDVEAVSSSRRPTPAVRPLNSRLDTGKLRRTAALDLPGWQTGVARSVRALVQGHKG
jgi:dTDP-4-dehydrorhamnose reductase